MIKYLYSNWGWFRSFVQELVERKAPKAPKDFEALKHVFTDSKGQRYYQFIDPYDIPLPRAGKIEEFNYQLQRKFNTYELDLFQKKMEDLNIRAIQNMDNKEIVREVLVKQGALVQEIALRENQVIHPELMFDMVAVCYIREDENPVVFDQRIHDEKVDQFKIDSVGRLYDFFYTEGMKRYWPYLEGTQKTLEELWAYSMDKIAARNKAITSL